MNRRADGVRRAEGRDVASIAELLADAFVDYPWIAWTVEAVDRWARVRSLQELVLRELVLPYGEVWVVDVAELGIVSAALWMVPEAEVPPLVSSAVAARSAELEGEHHGRSAQAQELVAGWRPASPHYELGAVGTRPEHQGRGHGSTVLRPVLERARTEGVDAYLETSSTTNVAFYESLGFTVERMITIPGGGPDVWSMMRRA